LAVANDDDVRRRHEASFKFLVSSFKSGHGRPLRNQLRHSMTAAEDSIGRGGFNLELELETNFTCAGVSLPPDSLAAWIDYPRLELWKPALRS